MCSPTRAMGKRAAFDLQEVVRAALPARLGVSLR